MSVNQPKIKNQPTPTIAQEEDQLRKLLEESIKTNQLVLKKLNWVYRWVVWQQAWSTIKILFIITAIVLGVIYIPAAIKQFLGPYEQLIDTGSNINYIINSNK